MGHFVHLAKDFSLVQIVFRNLFEPAKELEPFGYQIDNEYITWQFKSQQELETKISALREHHKKMQNYYLL